MEEVSDLIAEYVTSVEDIKNDAIKEAKIRLLDSVAVALASKNSPPAMAVEKLFSEFKGEYPSFAGNFTPDFSAFYNTLLIRYLDFNDTYLGLEPLHPSDMIGGMLALGKDVKGEDLLRGIVVGYDVGVKLCDSTSLRKKGFDHVNFLEIASTAGLANMLRLDFEKTKNAISLSIVPHVALRETRSGKLSMWKAGAAAEAIRNSVFSVLLAKSGVTAPEKPFSGVFGFSTLIAKDMDITKLKFNSEGIFKTSLKKYPVEYHAEAVVEAALNLQYEGEIREVVIETYEAAKTILADSEDKWDPKNKETADHSLPFITAVTLLKRDFWLDSYSLIGDERVKELMRKIKVIENEEYTKVYPSELPVTLRVRTDRGEYEYTVRSPRGYYNNPMSRSEVEEKALRLGLSEKVIKLIDEVDGMYIKDFMKRVVS